MAVLNVGDTQIRHFDNGFRVDLSPFCDSGAYLRYLAERCAGKPGAEFLRIAEHPDEQRGYEFTEAVGGLRPQPFDLCRPVQYADDPPLLVEGWKRNQR